MTKYLITDKILEDAIDLVASVSNKVKNEVLSNDKDFYSKWTLILDRIHLSEYEPKPQQSMSRSVKKELTELKERVGSIEGYLNEIHVKPKGSFNPTFNDKYFGFLNNE